MKKFCIMTCLLLVAAGCTEVPPPNNNSPFAGEETPYQLGILFDVGPEYRDRVLGSNPTALRYALEVQQIYFRDRAEKADRVVWAAVGGGNERSVLIDMLPKSFKVGYPNGEADVRNYLIQRTERPGPRLNSYDGISQCLDYMLKERVGNGKMAVLVYSSLRNDGPDPAKSRERLVHSLSAYARAGGFSCWYWVPWESELEKLFNDAGLTGCQFVPGPRIDPVRPTFLDSR